MHGISSERFPGVQKGAQHVPSGPAATDRCGFMIARRRRTPSASSVSLCELRRALPADDVSPSAASVALVGRPGPVGPHSRTPGRPGRPRKRRSPWARRCWRCWDDGVGRVGARSGASGNRGAAQVIGDGGDGRWLFGKPGPGRSQRPGPPRDTRPGRLPFGKAPSQQAAFRQLRRRGSTFVIAMARASIQQAPMVISVARLGGSVTEVAYTIFESGHRRMPWLRCE